MTLEITNTVLGACCFTNVNESKERMDKSQKNRDFIYKYTTKESYVKCIFYDFFHEFKNIELKEAMKSAFLREGEGYVINEFDFVAVYKVVFL